MLAYQNLVYYVTTNIIFIAPMIQFGYFRLLNEEVRHWIDKWKRFHLGGVAQNIAFLLLMFAEFNDARRKEAFSSRSSLGPTGAC